MFTPVDNAPPRMASRKNAMLTSEDRRWLTGEKTYEGQHAKQQRYQRRRDIRERVYNAILDFSILFDHLDDAERSKIFGEVVDDGRQWIDTDEDFRAGVRDGLAFLLRGTGIRSLMLPESDGEQGTVAEQFLKMAIQRAGNRDGYLVDDVQIAIEASEVAVPELLEAIESGEELSPSAVYLLMDSGVLEVDVVQECLREQLRRLDMEVE